MGALRSASTPGMNSPAHLGMKRPPAIFVALSLLGLCLASPSAEQGALSSCNPAEEHACCYPPGEISVNNCDCDAGYLCDIYCTETGFATSWYDGHSEVCCCDNRTNMLLNIQ